MLVQQSQCKNTLSDIQMNEGLVRRRAIRPWNLSRTAEGLSDSTIYTVYYYTIAYFLRSGMDSEYGRKGNMAASQMTNNSPGYLAQVVPTMCLLQKVMTLDTHQDSHSGYSRCHLWSFGLEV